MAEWLHFMAQLAQAQHVAATMLRPFAGPSLAAVEQATGARMPPLAADGYRRDAAWRDGLAILLDAPDSVTIPTPAKAVIASFRSSEAAAVEALADRFLRGAVASTEAGAALYVAAALQVYFTRLAAQLPLASPAAAAAAWALPVLRVDSRRGRGACVRPDAGRALSALLSLRGGLESRPRCVHLLRPVAVHIVEGN